MFPLCQRPGSLSVLDDDTVFLTVFQAQVSTRWNAAGFERAEQLLAHLAADEPFWEAEGVRTMLGPAVIEYVVLSEPFGVLCLDAEGEIGWLPLSMNAAGEVVSDAALREALDLPPQGSQTGNRPLSRRVWALRRFLQGASPGSSGASTWIRALVAAAAGDSRL